MVTILINFYFLYFNCLQYSRMAFLMIKQNFSIRCRAIRKIQCSQFFVMLTRFVPCLYIPKKIFITIYEGKIPFPADFSQVFVYICLIYRKKQFFESLYISPPIRFKHKQIVQSVYQVHFKSKTGMFQFNIQNMTKKHDVGCVYMINNCIILRLDE